ncbi:FAD/NAD(P)-binding domain-containing protein [Gonapodya prolifera JEL478]|uniref:FAD/NAD(P)-binding domain-containing protein n=1 Tax=Gonapodya prolifera (strain JEL478) TaxID=1344416 RepID=A0A139AWG2_GONPJ|nr:FAD/NAD(P)-binding domain-containing protein [Gonapodya prolifera JEL478]|eukprot:KXS21044.1 FAD/NAD(P)-binding domain-containing protein [Gonapodya prolifera JEL478]
MQIETTVVLIGAGFSGIMLGAQLVKAGVRDFKILETASGFGGTWYWNRYPGASCVSLYCYLPLLEDTGYMPEMKYSSGTEILKYCERMGEHFGLYERAIFETGAKEFRWDETSHVWCGTTDRGDTITTKFLVSCGGSPFNHPQLPAIEGIAHFKGREFHTSRWDYDFTGGDPRGNDFNLHKLENKVVGIVGTGATAIQIIPHLGKHSKHLYVFQRTPSAVDVRNNVPTDPAWWKEVTAQKGWQYEQDEEYNRFLATITSPAPPDKSAKKKQLLVDDGFIISVREMFDTMEKNSKDGQLSLGKRREIADFRLMERLRHRVEDIVEDKKTAEMLKPWYDLFCKRPQYSDYFLQTFNRPNVTLVDTAVSKGIERITEKGIVVSGLEYPLDVIVWSTGFSTTALGLEPKFNYKVLGRSGLTVKQKCDANGGYATFLGLVTSDFPNYFMFGHAQAAVSVNFPSVYTVEARWIGYVIAEALSMGCKTVECTRETEEAWTEEILRASRINTEYLMSCTPGTFNAEGDIEKFTKLKRSQNYGGGLLKYRDIVDAYIKEGELNGFHISM